jgi:hypothetical protein
VVLPGGESVRGGGAALSHLTGIAD